MQIKLKGYHKGTQKEIDHKEVLRLMYNAACDVWPENLAVYDVVPFINMKDSTGKELFEGDILEGFSHVLKDPCNEIKAGKEPEFIDERYVCSVIFKDGEFKLYRKDQNHIFGIHFASRSKVIGNIYQNKDLLI